MTPSDKQAFWEALGKASRCFPSFRLEREIGAAYWDALSDLPLETVEKALNAAVRTGLFFPSVGEIRKAASGNAAEKAQDAWTQLRKMIRNRGAEGSYDLLDSASWTALRAVGGQMHLCRYVTETELDGRIRREFLAEYKTALARELREGTYQVNEELLPAATKPSALLTDGG